VEAFKIPSRSMVPTLAVGDHIFVNKFAYGPMIPGTHTRLLSRMPPSRGDVIVFQFPERPEQDFIKRTIAIPGDVLEAYDGRPVINGWVVPRCKVGSFGYQEPESGYSSNHSGELFMEYLGKESYLTFFDQMAMTTASRSACKVDADCQQQISGTRCLEGYCAEYQGPYKVKPGEVWVMGDNRNNSHDSRGWFDGRGGGVPFDNIRGKALFVWMSFTQANSIAWDRIGVSVMGRPKLPVDDEAKLRERISECLKNRPPVEQTTPPPSK
jgi:signal peptidase I